MCLTDRQRSELDCALARVPPGVHPDAAAAHRLMQILKDLPPDCAWWVSHLVVRYQDAQFRRSQLSADREQRADVPLSEYCLKQYATLRLVRSRNLRNESAVVSGEDARRSGEICCGRDC